MHWNVFAPTALLAALVLSGCATQPQDGDPPLKRKDEAVTFAGYISEAGGLVELQQRRCSDGQFVKFSSVRSSTTPAFADNCGVTWYEYSASRTVSQDNAYWCRVNFSAFARTTVRARWANINVGSYTQGHQCYPSQYCGAVVYNECLDKSGEVDLLCEPNSACDRAVP